MGIVSLVQVRGRKQQICFSAVRVLSKVNQGNNFKFPSVFVTTSASEADQRLPAGENIQQKG